MKKMKKVVSVLLTISMLISFGTMVFANNSSIGGVTISTPSNNELAGIGNNVLGYVQWFGYTIAVGMLLYIGIKYMMSSANEKADLKKGSVNYVIGAVIVAAAATIVGILSRIGGSIQTQG